VNLNENLQTTINAAASAISQHKTRRISQKTN
ncbi:MAG: hypothetical protein ACJAVP_003589, partial [Spirosomataceae bacterium]